MWWHWSIDVSSGIQISLLHKFDTSNSTWLFRNLRSKRVYRNRRHIVCLEYLKFLGLTFYMYESYRTNDILKHFRENKTSYSFLSYVPKVFFPVQITQKIIFTSIWGAIVWFFFNTGALPRMMKIFLYKILLYKPCLFWALHKNSNHLSSHLFLKICIQMWWNNIVNA